MAGATFRPVAHRSISLGAGMKFDGELRLEDAEGVKLVSERYGPAGTVALLFKMQH